MIFIQVPMFNFQSIKFPIGQGNCWTCGSGKIFRNKALNFMFFQTGESLNIGNAYEDARFNNEIDLKTGYHTQR